MSRQQLTVTGLAVLVALALACGDHQTQPTAPSSVIHAAADGSTLKTTAPVPQSPINGAQPPQGQTVTLVVANSTALFVSGVSLSYRFEVTNAAGAVVDTALVAGGSSTT